MKISPLAMNFDKMACTIGTLKSTDKKLSTMPKSCGKPCWHFILPITEFVFRNICVLNLG